MNQSAFRTTIRERQAAGIPLLAFNVVDLASLQGVLDAAARVDEAVIIQLSARTTIFYGASTISSAVRAAAAEAGAIAFLHLDHCADDQVLALALAAGFDGIMTDGSHLPFEQNMSWTRSWVDRARITGAVVEGELGAIAGAEDGFQGAASSSTVDTHSYKTFATQTGVDLMGTDIGTAHGHYLEVPRVRVDRVRDLVNQGGPGFVVHGCSGLPGSLVRDLVLAGATKLNYSTDLKSAWAAAIRTSSSWGESPEPIAALRSARDAVAEMAVARWANLEAAR